MAKPNIRTTNQTQNNQKQQKTSKNKQKNKERKIAINTRSHDCRVQQLGHAGGGHEDHLLLGAVAPACDAVELREEAAQHAVSGAPSSRAFGREHFELVDHDQARGAAACMCEQRGDGLLGVAHVLGNQLSAVHHQQIHLALVGHCQSQTGLASAYIQRNS